MRKNRILILALTLLIGGFAFSQQLVEPAKNYYYNFDNDCSIKALSAALDASYKDSYMLLKEYYIKDTGTPTRDFFKVVHTLFPDSELISVDNLSPEEFIEVLPVGRYIVVARGHTFFIGSTDDESGWKLVGVRTDYNREIFLAVRLN